MKARSKADWFGMLVGFLAFAAGIGVLFYTFRLALDMFAIPPDQAIGITKDKAVDFAKTSSSLIAVAIRIVLLLVMAGVGSMISNRGIKMYVSARATPSIAGHEDVSTPQSSTSAEL